MASRARLKSRWARNGIWVLAVMVRLPRASNSAMQPAVPMQDCWISGTRVRALDDVRRGLLDRRGHIARGVRELQGNEVRVERSAPCVELVHQRGALGQRLLGAEDARQRLVLDLDQVDGFPGDVGIDGRDRGHLVAELADLVAS